MDLALPARYASRRPRYASWQNAGRAGILTPHRGRPTRTRHARRRMPDAARATRYAPLARAGPAGTYWIVSCLAPVPVFLGKVRRSTPFSYLASAAASSTSCGKEMLR